MKSQPDRHLLVVGKNLKRERKNANISQEALALDAEIDRTYVSQIERGIGNPSILVLKTLADRLGVPLTELVRGL
jgi:transcriptional regulator with XRE-family HTH domain